MRPYHIALPATLFIATCAAAQAVTNNPPPEPPPTTLDSAIVHVNVRAMPMAEAPAAAEAESGEAAARAAALAAAMEELAAMEAAEAAPLTLLAGERLAEVPAGRSFTFIPGGPGTHLKGDLDFGANGPEMTMRARLRTTPGGRQLWLEISLEANEIRSDWTQIRGKSTPVAAFVVATADPGFRIKSFTPAEEDWWRTIDVDEGPERYLPREAHLGLPPYDRVFREVLNQLRQDSSRGALVREWVATGDVAGPDVGRTGVKVTLRKVQVVMAPEAP